MTKLLFLCLFAMVFATVSCGSKDASATGNGKPAVSVSSNQKNSAPVKSVSEPEDNTAVPASIDKIGVAECDDYITKVEACLIKKVPETSRAAYRPAFDQLKKSWKDAATTPQGKSALAAGCKQSLEAAKQAYASFSCEF